MKKNSYTKKQLQKHYWYFGGIGTALLGFGLSALVESGFLKHSNTEQWRWIAAGTISLVIIMAGLNFLLESFACKQQLNNLK
jgi:predicted kinase